MTGPDPVVTYGASTHAVRGDYSHMRANYTVDQDYASYSDADRDRWRRLYARQMRLVPGRACPEFLRVIETLGYDTGIPRFDEVNQRLSRATVRTLTHPAAGLSPPGVSRRDRAARPAPQAIRLQSIR